MVHKTHLLGLLLEYLDLLVDLGLEEVVEIHELADYIHFVVVVREYLAHCDCVFPVLDQ